MTPERDRDELAFRIALVPLLVTVKGFASPEVGETYTRARALCHELGERLLLIRATWGLSAHYLVCGQPRRALEIARELRRLIEGELDTPLLTLAHLALGSAFYYLGELPVAHSHFQQALAAYSSERHPWPEHYGAPQDLRVTCLRNSAWAAWGLGYPERALAAGRAATDLARVSSHSPSLTAGLLCMARLHQFRREPDLTRQYAQTVRKINGSSMSNYHLDLGRLQGELIAVDGFRTAPVRAARFPIAVAQRLDIRLAPPREPAAHPVLAVLEGDRRQTGIVLAVGRAPITRIGDTAARPSAPLTLDLERRLRAAEPLLPRKADRVHTLDLTGDMARYIWSINNVAWNKDVPPLPIAKDEWVELVIVNRTRMPHPMHLHGHEFQVVEIDGERFSGAVRDTVLVTPDRRVVIAFDANNPGLWAFHCHLLYHLDAGMFTTLRYL